MQGPGMGREDSSVGHKARSAHLVLRFLQRGRAALNQPLQHTGRPSAQRASASDASTKSAGTGSGVHAGPCMGRAPSAGRLCSSQDAVHRRALALSPASLTIIAAASSGP